MVSDDDVRVTKAIQRRTGRTFHLATRLLPDRIRYPTYVLYAFFRVADEVVDRSDDPDPAAQRERLEHIRAAAVGDVESDDEVLSAFQTLRRDHDLTDADVHAFVDAMAMDIERDRYETHDDLEAYMRGSAVAVGYLMLDVMDPEDAEAARPHAGALARAFQLTNFLRDVREDLDEYGRVYLPQATLEEYGLTESDLEAGVVTPAFRSAMRRELARTEVLYREGVAGIRYLPDDCQFGVLLSAVLYADHHRLIRARDFDVLSATPSLSRRRRLWLLVRTWWHWRRHRDPEAAFYAVSPVAERPTGSHPDRFAPDPEHVA